MIGLLIGLLFTLNSWSTTDLQFAFKNDRVKQGEIVNASLVVLKTDGQTMFSGLKGKNIAKTIYLLNVSPFMMKSGQLEAEARIIFLTVPQSSFLIETINGEQFTFSWKPIEVEPTETSKSFLLGDFEIPERFNFAPWIIGLVGLTLLLVIGRWVYSHFSKKGKLKLQKSQLKQELMACSNYNDVVALWKKKRNYLKVFPEVEDAFTGLEEVLFKYQFKPKQTDFEMQEVLSAYQKFKTNVAGVLNGI